MKKHYGMSAENVAARAPYTTLYKEVPVMMDWKPQLLYGWVVLDKNGDKVFPPTDVGAQSLCDNCAEELNLVAAKWLMEHEGSPKRGLEWDVTNEGRLHRYRK